MSSSFETSISGVTPSVRTQGSWPQCSSLVLSSDDFGTCEDGTSFVADSHLGGTAPRSRFMDTAVTSSMGDARPTGAHASGKGWSCSTDGDGPTGGGSKPCKNGPTCKFHQKGRCRFFHPLALPFPAGTRLLRQEASRVPPSSTDFHQG